MPLFSGRPPGSSPYSPRLSSIKDHAASVVSDEAFEKRAERWSEDTPDTKEAYFIRDVFDSASHRPAAYISSSDSRLQVSSRPLRPQLLSGTSSWPRSRAQTTC